MQLQNFAAMQIRIAQLMIVFANATRQLDASDPTYGPKVAASWKDEKRWPLLASLMDYGTLFAGDANTFTITHAEFMEYFDTIVLPDLRLWVSEDGLTIDMDQERATLAAVLPDSTGIILQR